ncbi:MAG: hypothetical protein H6719_22425 [Sandaracinaceae bacterium]|nr:hypothetical protein [Sandaracinaceae bacterium]
MQALKRALPTVAAVAAFVVALRALAFACAYPAGALYDGDLDAQAELAHGMERWVEADLSRDDFATGSSRFDGEWLFATRMMAVLGYAQTAIEHPELAEAHGRLIDRAIDGLVDEPGRAFDREAWGRDPLDDLGSPRPHVAYLGYLALATSMARLVNPDSRHAALEQRIVDHLVARFEASELGLLESYPGEAYPIDNTSFFGALAVHDRATGEDHRALITHLCEGLASRYRDPHTGLLYQSVDPEDGGLIDGPRASGTALGAYFVSFADPSLSRALYRSMQSQLLVRTMGFGTTREYPPGHEGRGDVDSGPVLLGQGVSATGFTLALARIHGDRETYEATYATASFFGGPLHGNYALGGPIGDGLLFALVTALPASRWSEA